jgi:hypothetical protein
MSRSQICISWLSSSKALEFIYERHLALKPFHMQQVGFLLNFSGFFDPHGRRSGDDEVPSGRMCTGAWHNRSAVRVS